MFREKNIYNINPDNQLQPKNVTIALLFYCLVVLHYIQNISSSLVEKMKFESYADFLGNSFNFLFSIFLVTSEGGLFKKVFSLKMAQGAKETSILMLCS